MSKNPVTRRSFLALSGGGVAALVVAACTPSSDPTTTTSAPPVAPGESSTTTSFTGGPVDIEISLRAIRDTVAIRSGIDTDVWRYVAEVTEGDPGAVSLIEGSYLGPTFHFRKGQRVRIIFDNEIPDRSIVHWHGLDVPEDMDGHPRFAVPEGGQYVYEFTVENRAGTYWYHPHPHGRTGPQVYAGMAGLILITDDEEESLSLPGGEFDVPVVIQDRTFDGDRMVYLPNGMMDQMNGFLGEEILVNGTPDASFGVAGRSYRLRILNGSNSRIYKLAWDDSTPLVVLTTDGGLLENPVTRPYVTLGPAERVDLWVDFGADSVGDTRKLISLPFIAPSGGMMGGSSSLPLGTGFDVASFTVDRAAESTDALPDNLSDPGFASLEDAVNRNSARVVTLAMAGGGWTLNGRRFEMLDVASDEEVKLGTTEIWEFYNAGGGMGGGMGGGGGGGGLPHPMHMHGQQFQIIARTIEDSGRNAWDSVREGYVDDGWKDTVLVMPGERVRVLRRFTTFPGLFLYHCHNLEHEDMGMMRNFRINEG